MTNTFTEESRISNIEQKLAAVSNIISIDASHSSRLTSRSKKQIQLWLEAEARTLIDKKERYLQKQERLKQIEDQYERIRDEKQHYIEQKIHITERNKNKNLEGVQKKLLGVASRHQSVINRHRNDESRELDKLFDERKSLFIEDNRPSSKKSSSSRFSSTSKSRIVKPLPKDEQIEKSIQVINQRIQKAKSTTNERKINEINRIKHHNTTDLQQAQLRAKSSFEQQQSVFENKITKRLLQASHNKESYQKSIQKRIQDKQKAYSFKLRAYQDNLKSIQNQQSNKLEELNKKFEQSRSGDKTWKDERGSLYQKKFFANLSLLEQQKISRADRILQKHQEITDKNRIYKQRKDSLLQAIKYNPSRNY